jgi:regulator of protease activity HflC (stomatin/prohibitin superfamily)
MNVKWVKRHGCTLAARAIVWPWCGHGQCIDPITVFGNVEVKSCRSTKMKFATRLLPLALTLIGCASQDIPQAYRGRMFHRTGAFAFYGGGNGFDGPVLDPGTYYTGSYDELHMVQCTVATLREPLNALTKDGVQFRVDVYIRYSANCSDPSVVKILQNMAPDNSGTVSSEQLYQVYVRPTLLEVVREVVSPFKANDINDQRETVLQGIRERFINSMRKVGQDMVAVHDISLANLDFPEEMDRANVERAVQAVLKDKAIAERSRVEAEIDTAKLRIQLSEQEAQSSAVRVMRVGDMLKKSPEYLQFDLQSKMPDIYRQAGVAGNMILAAPNPVMVPALKLTPPTIAPVTPVIAPRIAPAKSPARTSPVAKSADGGDD